jgi:outer membrane protein assembly factor BamB
MKSVGGWSFVTKPRPAEMDDFTHHNYDAGCNRVGRDRLAEAPFSMRWMDGPQWTTSYSGPYTMVSAGGRIFTGVEERYRFGNDPSRVFITARDAYNGKVLWRRRAQGFKALAAVATEDVIYSTLQPKTGPLVSLDAVTGEVKRTYKEAGAAEWAVLVGNRLIIGAGSKGGVKCVSAGDGKVLWSSKRAIPGSKKTPNVAVDAKKGEIYFAQFVRKSANPPTIGCLDLATGAEKWAVPAEGFPAGKKARGGGLASYSSEHGIVVLGAGSAFEGGGAYAYSTRDGKRLWTADYRLVCSGRGARHKGSSYIDGYFIDGLFWILAGRGNYKSKEEMKAAGPRQAIGWHGYDPKTGKVVKRLDLEDKEYIGDSCHRTNASVLYFLGGHSRFVDRRTGRLAPRCYSVHNGCHFGMIPANGLWYTSSLYLNYYILGEMGLAGKREMKPDAPTAPDRLVRGPGSPGGPEAGDADWPAFRANAMGTGRNMASIPPKPAELWAKKIGQRLGPPIAVGGTVYVADLDGLKVLAVDARSGAVKWSHTVGGRVLAPPTYHKGTILFGCGDGRVYCLSAADGKLVWRFRAAPALDRIIVRERLESVWPVHTGVLVSGGKALFAAGRAGTLDGGADVFALDAATGKLAWHKHDDTVSIVQLGVTDGKSYQLHYKTRFSVANGGKGGNIKGAAHNPDVLMTSTRLGKAAKTILAKTHVRAAANDGKRVATAGPPVDKTSKRRDKGGIVNYPEDKPDLKEGVVHVFSSGGDELGSVKIDGLPVFDGLCAAGGGLFLTTQDGKLRCFGGK